MPAPSNIDLLPAQATVFAGVKPDGTVAPVALDANSRVLTTDSASGGATADNQTTQIARADTLITAAADQLAALSGLSTEATLDLVRAAVATNGGKLDTLHIDLGLLLTEATGVAIEAQLVGSGATLDSILDDMTGILAALGPLATGADVGVVENAVLAGNATLTSIAGTIAGQATAAKQDALKAVADAMAADLVTVVAKTTAIDANTDGLEASATTQITRLTSILGQLDVLVAAINYGDPTFELSRTGSWRGKVGYVVNVIGRRASFTANVLNDLVMFTPSAGSSTVINEMAGTEALEIVSSNTADAAAGTGVRTVEITYIDALGTVGAQNTTTVTLNGTTPVSLGAVRALAIQWAEAATVGSGGVAAGDITIRASATPTNIYELISAGGNRSMSGRYMVPVGMSAYVNEWQGSAVSQDMDIRMRATVKMGSRALTTPYLFQDAMYPPAGSTSPSRALPWLKFPAGSKIKISAMPPAAGASPRAEASFALAVITN